MISIAKFKHCECGVISCIPAGLFLFFLQRRAKAHLPSSIFMPLIFLLLWSVLPLFLRSPQICVPHRIPSVEMTGSYLLIHVHMQHLWPYTNVTLRDEDSLNSSLGFAAFSSPMEWFFGAVSPDDWWICRAAFVGRSLCGLWGRNEDANEGNWSILIFFFHLLLLFLLDWKRYQEVIGRCLLTNFSPVLLLEISRLLIASLHAIFTTAADREYSYATQVSFTLDRPQQNGANPCSSVSFDDWLDEVTSFSCAESGILCRCWLCWSVPLLIICRSCWVQEKSQPARLEFPLLCLLQSFLLFAQHISDRSRLCHFPAAHITRIHWNGLAHSPWDGLLITRASTPDLFHPRCSRSDNSQKSSVCIGNACKFQAGSSCGRAALSCPDLCPHCDFL